MPPENELSNPEREQTDESLRIEREKADEILGQKLAAIEETAEAVIGAARKRADELLAQARAKSDRQHGASGPQSFVRTEARRALEDEAVREERADADEVVRLEREERVSRLANEREETDKDLLSERVMSDGAVATRDDFLGMVSHDLRNMLSGIVVFAALIAKEESRENAHGKALMHAQRIQRSAARMSHLIGDLVDVASIEAGVLAVTREEADPGHVVTEAVDTFQAQAAGLGISLVVDIVQPLSLAAFDSARILQVLTNLLANAMKFTPPNGKVSVRVESREGEHRFSVSDTGAGIPADNLEDVFERFRQVIPNDRRGVGLGLYISKCIVQGHGGRIWVESKVGEGSTFSFTLPVRAAP